MVSNQITGVGSVGYTLYSTSVIYETISAPREKAAKLCVPSGEKGVSFFTLPKK